MDPFPLDFCHVPHMAAISGCSGDTAAKNSGLIQKQLQRTGISFAHRFAIQQAAHQRIGSPVFFGGFSRLIILTVVRNPVIQVLLPLQLAAIRRNLIHQAVNFLL